MQQFDYNIFNFYAKKKNSPRIQLDYKIKKNSIITALQIPNFYSFIRRTARQLIIGQSLQTIDKMRMPFEHFQAHPALQIPYFHGSIIRAACHLPIFQHLQSSQQTQMSFNRSPTHPALQIPQFNIPLERTTHQNII